MIFLKVTDVCCFSQKCEIAEMQSKKNAYLTLSLMRAFREGKLKIQCSTVNPVQVGIQRRETK
jgi:hypothetical protein